MASKEVLRDPQGRILPGSAPNNPRGRPSLERERAYLKTMQENVSLADWAEITMKAVKQAKQGNRYARDWLARYLVPEPKEAMDVGGALIIRYVDNWRDAGS